MFVKSLPIVLATVAYAVLSVSASAIPSEDFSSSLLGRDLKTCPALNNYVYTAPNGGTWKIGCNRDTQFDGDRTEPLEDIANLEACIKICGDNNHKGWCKSVSWPGNVNQQGACYLKGANTGDRVERTGWKLAYKL